MSSESQMSAYNAGARGGVPIGVAAEDMAAFQAGDRIVGQLRSQRLVGVGRDQRCGGSRDPAWP